MSESLERIEEAVGHRFADQSVLVTALTHSSYASEHPAADSYERLEFLGDAVLELVTTQMIFEAVPDAGEGPMTKMRASMVDEPTLVEVARSWGLASGLRLGVGEDRSGGRQRSSILSDIVESVIAAVYLDGGFDVVQDIVLRAWTPILSDRLERSDIRDARSALQEALAKSGRVLTFEFVQSGPDHAVEFAATALVDGEAVGRGVGRSKKVAAIEAASDALDRERPDR